jgi:hypothetical protein
VGPRHLSQPGSKPDAIGDRAETARRLSGPACGRIEYFSKPRPRSRKFLPIAKLFVLVFVATGTVCEATEAAQAITVSSLVDRRAPDDVTVRAVRLDAPLRVDGRLDDDAYRRVEPLSDFIQQEPREGRPATEKTEAWIFFDDDNLYVAARCWDSHPEREVANELRRDNGNILGNENITFVIDTFHDRHNGYSARCAT